MVEGLDRSVQCAGYGSIADGKVSGAGLILMLSCDTVWLVTLREEKLNIMQALPMIVEKLWTWWIQEVRRTNSRRQYVV